MIREWLILSALTIFKCNLSVHYIVYYLKILYFGYLWLQMYMAVLESPKIYMYVSLLHIWQNPLRGLRVCQGQRNGWIVTIVLYFYFDLFLQLSKIIGRGAWKYFLLLFLSTAFIWSHQYDSNNNNNKNKRNIMKILWFLSRVFEL